MDKYIVVKVRKNVDGKRDYLQVDSWACGSPIIVNQERGALSVWNMS